MNINLFYCCATSLVLLTISACKKTTDQKTIFPGDRWEKAHPISQGVDETIMLEALEYLKSKSFENGNEEVLIIRNGRAIYQGDSINKKHNIWSCSKSFTSTVLGLMVDDGMVGLDDKVYQYEALLKDNYQEITFRHFTTMTSGYNAIGDSRWNESSKDWSWTPYQPGAPIFTPGSQYAYWDEAMMMKGKALTNVLGKTMNLILMKK